MFCVYVCMCVVVDVEPSRRQNCTNDRYGDRQGENRQVQWTLENRHINNRADKLHVYRDHDDISRENYTILQTIREKIGYYKVAGDANPPVP